MTWGEEELKSTPLFVLAGMFFDGSARAGRLNKNKDEILEMVVMK